MPLIPVNALKDGMIIYLGNIGIEVDVITG